jgi:putative ABC transport system permease protein
VSTLLAIPSFIIEAAVALGHRRLRSFLSILGLSMSIATLTILQLIGTATMSGVRVALNGIDEQSFFIFPSAGSTDTTRTAFGKNELERMRTLSPNILSVIPLHSTKKLIRIGHQYARLILRGDNDLDKNTANTHVCVLSASAYHKLFPKGGKALGNTLHVGEQRYTIIGVRTSAMNSLTPTFLHGDILIPSTTYERTQGHDQPVFALRFIVDDTRKIAQTESAVTAYLDTAKRKAGRYQFFDRAALASTIDAVSVTLALSISLISSIALLVAGIGIMNVMLVSVAERIREIGVRKAIGANNTHIFMQFLSEAFLLSLIGCGIGCAGGLLIGHTLDHTVIASLTNTMPQTAWKSSLVITGGMMTAITLLFGTYPAYHAMRHTPMEALRAQ